mmetsp:Transcript_56426/g.123945  ORF Transcript_56426/g.123945 Transcript_56426/m.123945 type:complete len:228 (+) Transcript_56426:314-997(+)
MPRRWQHRRAAHRGIASPAPACPAAAGLRCGSRSHGGSEFAFAAARHFHEWRRLPPGDLPAAAPSRRRRLDQVSPDHAQPLWGAPLARSWRSPKAVAAWPCYGLHPAAAGAGLSAATSCSSSIHGFPELTFAGQLQRAAIGQRQAASRRRRERFPYEHASWKWASFCGALAGTDADYTGWLCAAPCRLCADPCRRRLLCFADQFRLCAAPRRPCAEPSRLCAVPSRL